MLEHDTTRKPASKPVRGLIGFMVSTACLALVGCNAVPSDGPVASRVESSAVADSNLTLARTKLAYDVIQVDQRVANSVTQLGQPSLVRTFGFGGPPGTPVIGVGDALNVMIFEAGPDGLFSTTERKSTVIPVVVQPDGYGQIPYVGLVKFAGMTLDQAREAVANSLKAKAVEPDVIVSMDKSTSRTVSVLGFVGRPSVVPLGLGPEPLSRVIANAGGPTKSPFDTYVSLTRGNKVGKVLFQSILENPKDDINVRPGDKIFLTYDPRTFSALGSGIRAGNIPMEAGTLSLIEASALSGGSNSAIADAKGYFVFRYEYEPVYRQVAGEDRFRELLANGMMANKEGLYPIVYRFDMSDPQSYIVAQSFPVRNKDVLYISHHPAVDFAKFTGLVSGQLSVAQKVDTLAR